jgi:hypothetical protein
VALPIQVTITEAQALAAMRGFLMAALPEATPVVIGQDNRVPEPGNADFVVITPLFEERIETNTDTYFDGFFSNPQVPGTLTIGNPQIVTVQLDVHGEHSGDNTHLIVTLFRSEWGCNQFAASGFDVTPLHTGEPPHQIPYNNGEQQIENRWVIDCVMQVNPLVTVPQDFCASLGIKLIEVDVVYPPH